MGHCRLLSFWMLLAVLFPAGPAWAQNQDVPETGYLREDLFAAGMNAVCGGGADLRQGCEEIRNRKIVDAAQAPWRAIGRVNFASIQTRMHCTGTLVSGKVVLTASHCLYNFARKAWIPPQSIRFIAGYQRGTGQAVSGVARYVVHPVHDTASRDFSANSAQDWAILILKDPIGRKTGFIRPELEQTAGEEAAGYSLAGYAGLRPHVLSVAENCGSPVNGAGQPVILQGCAAMFGDSGAPVLVKSNGGNRVAAVFVGARLAGTSVQSISIPVARFRDALLLELEREAQ